MTAATVPHVPVAPVAPVMQQQPQPIRQPAPIPAPVVQQPVAEDETEQQKALLMKVLQLTDDQINALPPQTRDQIRQLVRLTYKTSIEDINQQLTIIQQKTQLTMQQ